MTTTVQAADGRISSYLGDLDAALGQALEKSEILREIRAHILDSVADAPNRDDATARVLRMLGTPQELAGRYRMEHLLTHASRSFSPWLLLQTTWRWAKLGMRGVLAFVVALFGYSIALAMTVAVLLKPFVSGVGMWVGSEGLNLGMPSHPENMHELLGKWFVPVIAACAFAFAIGTTQALRWIIRKRTREIAY
jgi:uncharacterized membrane protein